MSRKFKKKKIFDVVITDTKRIMLLKTAEKSSCSFKNYISLFNVEAVFVHELPPLFFKTFSTILHYSMNDDTDDFNFCKYISNLKY